MSAIGKGGSWTEVKRLADQLFVFAGSPAPPSPPPTTPVGYAPRPHERAHESVLSKVAAGAVGAIVPLPDMPTQLRDIKIWTEWLSAVESSLSEYRTSLLHKVDTLREAVSSSQLSAANRAHEVGESARKDAAPLLAQWLTLEGERRLIESLQARERERLRTHVLKERAEAFRRASGTPVAERLAVKRAERELRVVAAAEAEVSRVLATPVQVRKYHDGIVALVLIDAREGERVRELAASTAAQDLALTTIAAYVGEHADDRFYMKLCERTEYPMEYSSGTVKEPATRMVIGVRREKKKQQDSEYLLSLFEQMHQKGTALGELFKVRDPYP